MKERKVEIDGDGLEMCFDEKMGASLWKGKKCVASLGLSDDFTNDSEFNDDEIRSELKGILEDNGLVSNGHGGWERD
jgi:hypothetical protein